MSSLERARSAEALNLLTHGRIEIKGRLPWSSNHTFLVDVAGRDQRAMLAIYKPGRGERPLWDFPEGLYRRELAAYVLSEALGWGVVPETVVRDGPLGEGSLQRFVDADFEQHYFTLLEDPNYHDSLRVLGVFDVIANNADRKGGHCLLGEGRIWGIDHGLCFHAHPKLRTVIWDFAGEAVPVSLLADVDRVACNPPAELAGLLDDEEVDAIVARARRLLRHPEFPVPRTERAYPWPLV